jgi:dynein heavy chain
VDESSRLLAGTIRFFKEREINSIMKIAQTVRAEIEEFKPKIPLMVALRKKGMVERHWEQISSKVGFKVKPDEGFTFQKVLDLGLLNFTDICVEIGERAAKEFAIETSLDSMESTWTSINFSLLEYKGTFIIKNYEDIQVVLDEHIISTQTMQFSPFKEPFKDRLLNWNNTLKVMSDILEEWAKCQREWMYLQPIFDSPDISKQLPNESKKFKTVNSTWTHTMEHSSKVRKVLDICTQEGLLERLQEANKNLEAIQKELNNYLEKKREKFARFYFLSNSDLLEILSQTK